MARRPLEKQLEAEVADLRARVEALERRTFGWVGIEYPPSAPCDQNCVHCESSACPYQPVRMNTVTYNSDRWGNVWLM